ncbi:hypothetical protein [Rhodohalobacter sp.]|uniref:hypothetical protein n=1 Tax=Rhodohalobacter sp. TaxID=1974210 RepID=UPI002ACD24C9|nr:hypothetical protein [Rhodohalobacter sp.]MDZ7758130.1 hypothetical protein [Rhodohalobacter sp.]
MKNLIYITLLFVLFICTKPAKAQDALLNLGYIPEIESLTVGISANSYELDALFKSTDNTSGFGLRGGYMITLLGDKYSSNFYIAPRLGYRFESYSDGTDDAEGLFYEAAAGFLLERFNFSVGYGNDELAETEYISVKLGFAFYF